MSQTTIDNKNVSNISSNNKPALTNMITEYNNLPDNAQKQSYINSVIEWYMREKSILSITNSSDIKENRYSNVNPYSKTVK